jgi:crotonobetainyl-CoA:carnitine CoA-transferase CaiB-like acyl-CoA transferase
MKAFEGIRVLDFTHVYAGPFASYQLAVMGAEVIKIESPHLPDMMRIEGSDPKRNAEGLGLSYCVNNQGKKAITLDISKPEGADIARQLIATADVLIENYVGTMQRFGLGPKPAHEINPALIYCSMSGYGSGSVKEGHPAFDNVIQAFSGMMSVNGSPTQDRLRVGPPLIDYGTGAQSAFSIASALFQRSRTGKGQVIEVNMVDAALMMMSPLIANAMYRGSTEERVGNQPGDRPGYCVYRCEDDDIMLGAFTTNQHWGLFTALGLDDLVSSADEVTPDWLTQNSNVISRQLSDCFKTRTASDWEAHLNQFDVPAARVRDLYQMLMSDQPQRSPSSQHQRLSDSDMTAPIAAFKYATDGPEFDSYCARHGEDTDSVLSELGISPEALVNLKKMAVI